jgi:hypothetical protein
MYQAKHSCVFLFTFFLISAFTAPAVFAEWLKLSDEKVLVSGYYIQTESVKQTGPMAIYRQVQVLHQNPLVTDKAFLSKLYLYEYDCMNKKFRLLRATGFGQAWAQGAESELLTIASAGRDWTELPDGDLGQITFDYLCPSGKED